MSRRTEKCPTCKGAGLITVDDWLIKGKTEEELAKAKEKAIADIVEVVRCKDCKHRYIPCRCALWYARVDDKEYFAERGEDFYCSYGERKE